MAPRPLTLLVIDDHALFRESLAILMRDALPDATILQCGEADAALRLADESPSLDLVLMDLTMPAMDGLDLLVRFRARHPTLPVLMVSASEDVRRVRRALDAGALGYVPKSASSRTLLSAIRLVLAGETYVPRLVLDGTRAAAADGANALDLTPRQIEVLRLLAAGRSNKEIARALDLTERTVKGHVTALLRSLGASNRVQAVERARAAALV